jgi:hypothetical protein
MGQWLTCSNSLHSSLTAPQMQKPDKVAVRYDPKRGDFVLFFVNSNDRGWWLKCFTLSEGHSEASRAYMRSLRPITEAQRPQAQALADRWATIPGGASSAVLVSRLSGPRGDVGPYIGPN